MHFASPYYLWLLSALVPMIAYYVWRTLQGGASIQISSVEGVVRAPKTVRYWLRHLPFVLRLAALALLIVALARPQDVERLSRTNTEGIDIMLAIDVSGSMLARDFRPDRITAAKEVAGSFIADRYGDRIGLVAFAGEAFTQSPLTTDQGTLQTLLARIRSGLIEDGTAIGNGLATAINRLRESEAKSKVIILLTDGVNKLASQYGQLDSGLNAYTDGVAQLKAGVQQLTDGAAQLTAGTGELRSNVSGIDMSDQLDSLLAGLNGSSEVESFTSAENTDVSAVQFALQTVAIEAPAPAAEPEAAPVALTFWQKLLKLFGLYKG